MYTGEEGIEGENNAQNEQESEFSGDADSDKECPPSKRKNRDTTKAAELLSHTVDDHSDDILNVVISTPPGLYSSIFIIIHFV